MWATIYDGETDTSKNLTTYTTNELKNLDNFKNCLQFKISFNKDQRKEISKLCEDGNFPQKHRQQIFQEIKGFESKLCNRYDTYNGHQAFSLEHALSKKVSEFRTEIDPNSIDRIFEKINETFYSEIERNFSKVSGQKLNKMRNEQKVKLTETNCKTLILYQIPEQSSSSESKSESESERFNIN